MEELTEAARHALGSLCRHPHLNTAELIASGPHRLQQFGVAGIRDGLLELERHGLAGERAGGWVLTPAGRDRCGSDPEEPA